MEAARAFPLNAWYAAAWKHEADRRAILALTHETFVHASSIGHSAIARAGQ
jgi:hypothetical protein